MKKFILFLDDIIKKESKFVMIKKLEEVLNEFKNTRYKVFETLQKLAVRFSNPPILINYINIEFYKIFYDFSKSDKMFFICVLLIFCHKCFNDCSNDVIDSFDQYVKFIEYTKKEFENKDATVLFDFVIRKVKEHIALKNVDVTFLDRYYFIELSKFRNLENLGAFVDNFINFVRFFPYLYLLILNYFDNSNEFLTKFYMSVDRKGKTCDRGIVITPLEVCSLINDIIERYLFFKDPSFDRTKKTYVYDPLAGPGNFSSTVLYSRLNTFSASKDQPSVYDSLIKMIPHFIINDRSASMYIAAITNLLLSDINSNFFEITKVDMLKLFNNIKVEDYCKSLKLNRDSFFYCYLNPPFEEEFKPSVLVSKIAEVIKYFKGIFVLLLPTVKFIMHKDELSFLDNFEIFRIRLQNNIFKDSGAFPGDVWRFKKHEEGDKKLERGLFLRFYDFSKLNERDPLIYDFTDSGLESISGRKGWKKDNFESKKNNLIDKIINDLKK